MQRAETRPHVFGGELKFRRVASTEQKSPAVSATEEAVEYRDRLPLKQHSALSLPPADRRTNGPASG